VPPAELSDDRRDRLLELARIQCQQVLQLLPGDALLPAPLAALRQPRTLRAVGRAGNNGD